MEELDKFLERKLSKTEPARNRKSLTDPSQAQKLKL